MNIIAPSTPALLREAVLHRVGMALSGLCLVHCLLLPLLLAAAPVMLLAAVPTGWLESEWFHAALIAPVVLVSGPALRRAGGARAGRAQGSSALRACFAPLITARAASTGPHKTGWMLRRSRLAAPARVWRGSRTAAPHGRPAPRAPQGTPPSRSPACRG